MSRTERLLKLLQILRGHRYPVTGQRLAEKLGVSIRTLYRDIATLQAQGAEIDGVAGDGYTLKPSFFLPPMMLSETETQALLLGMQWVTQFADAPLSKAAVAAWSKITEVLPATIKNSINTFALRVGPPAPDTMVNEDLSALRKAITQQQKIAIVYKQDNLKAEKCIVWPFTIGYFTDGRVLVAWCEKQKNYRHFKTAKISAIELLDEQYTRSRDSLFREWQIEQLKKHKVNAK